MSEAQSKRIVMLSMLIMAGYAVAKDLGKPSSIAKGSTYKQLWAVGALGIALSMAADVAPQVAGPFAMLVVLAFVAGGGNAITKVTHTALASSGSAN